MKNKHFTLLLVWYSVVCFMCLDMFLPSSFVYISVECLLINQILHEIRLLVKLLNFLFKKWVILQGFFLVILHTARICCTFVCRFTVGTLILHLKVGKYPENVKVKLH